MHREVLKMTFQFRTKQQQLVFSITKGTYVGKGSPQQ